MDNGIDEDYEALVADIGPGLKGQLMDNIERIVAQMPHISDEDMVRRLWEYTGDENPLVFKTTYARVCAIRDAQCRLDAQWILDQGWKPPEAYITIIDEAHARGFRDHALLAHKQNLRKVPSEEEILHAIEHLAHWQVAVSNLQKELALKIRSWLMGNDG